MLCILKTNFLICLLSCVCVLGTFIPVLPFYLDILSSFNFSKKSKKASMKPLDFSCILKLSKSQLTETGFKDATVESIYGGLLTYLADNSNKVRKIFPKKKI